MFLEDKFNLKYSYNFESGNILIYSNKFGSFKYYEWDQFGEKRIYYKY